MTRTKTILIVGLGNPEKKFEFTRHNLGFRVLDRVRQETGASPFKRTEKIYAEISEANVQGNRVLLAKPLTYMNESGAAVARLQKEFDIENDSLWLVHDDKDLDLGVMRVRETGSSAGHKGVQSVIDHLGSKNFKRYRLGILSAGTKKIDTDKFVLSKFLPEEEPTVRNLIDRATAQIKSDLDA